MKESDYAESTGTLRALEKKILTSSLIDRISDANSSDEALKAISQNSVYDFSALKRNEDYEQVLKANLKQAYSLLFKISPEPLIAQVLSIKYDYHNVKTLLKAKYLNKNFDHLLVEVSDLKPTLIKEVVSGNSKEKPDYIINAVAEGEKAFELANDPQAIDIVLDKLMFKQMLSLTNEIGNDFIMEYVKTTIDFYNIKTLLRMKEMQKDMKFLKEVLVEGGLVDLSIYFDNFDKPTDQISSSFYYKYFGDIVKSAIEFYEKSKNYSYLEKLCDNYLIELIKKSKYVAFGPEVLFAYLVAIENEIRQIRVIMTCKINEISSEVLRERLRDNYA